MMEYRTGWEDCVARGNDYDPNRVELAIDLRTGRAVVHAKIEECFLIMQDGVWYTRHHKDGVKLFKFLNPGEA